METLSGSIERITYYNPENGYSVLRLRPDKRNLPGKDAEGLITITGNMPEMSPGEYLNLHGKWVNHPKHGLQFNTEICQQTLPATIEGIRRYLGSGLIKGIGPKLANRIVAQFGDQTLDVIENKPEALIQVPDIGQKRLNSILSAWEEQKQVKEIMLILHSYGVSTNLAIKIYREYGDEAIGVLRSNPYQLAKDIHGVGFKTADKIAQSLGLPHDHPSRIEAGILFALNQAAEDGNVYLPAEELSQTACDLLEVPIELLQPALERLIMSKDVYEDYVPINVKLRNFNEGSSSALSEHSLEYSHRAVYITPLYFSETGATERLLALATPRQSRLIDVPASYLFMDPNLSGEQVQAINTALRTPLSVLTGGPGTGKTTALKALIEVLEASGKSYALASPTGRAAKRLSQATDRPASTLHRLLGYTPGEGFKQNESNPLSCDMLVVDEASMMDLHLTNHLLKALRPGIHILLVGDVDQLPSIGAGDVLRDIINSGTAPVTRLNRIFRQAADSHIITNAHRINNGEMPIFPKTVQSSGEKFSGDFYLFPSETAEQAADWIVELVINRIPANFGFQPFSDIQVLSPMYRGPCGVLALNQLLQEHMNPADARKSQKALFGSTYRVGDKVMQIQNNYDKDVFNGDIGQLTAFDFIEHSLTINFENRNVVYDWSEADQINLAYTVSVHKSQGSEFPAVVIPVLTQHYLMLQRNLLYTGLTRAKLLCVLVGNKRAISIAVRKNKVAHRFSALAWRLRATSGK